MLRLALLEPPLDRDEPLERDEPLPAREALLRLRVDAADLDRVDFAPVDFEVPDLDALAFEAPDLDAVDLAFVFDPDPLAEVLLRCPLRAPDLLLAIPDPSLTRFWVVFCAGFLLPNNTAQ